MSKKLLVAASLCAALTLVLSLQAAEKGEKEKFTATCPVSGKPAIEDSSLAYKGAKVYFCCAGCPKAFEENTEKYATKANFQLFQTKQANLVKCPIAGRDLNPETAITISGVKVCFCCDGCKGKVAGAEGAEQVELVFNEKAFAKGFEVKKPKKE